MTKIYRIPTGRVEGNGSNDSNTSEIRPYGEIGLFIGDNDKLELLMFDGVRTHVRSKVLNKGTFYGGDADSADGAGYDSIKLVPDEELRRNGSQQYIIVEPTGGEPGHVHIRAGGTIDQSTADLFLGGELNNVRISDLGNYVKISTDTGVEGITNNWTFDTTGILTFPNNALVDVADSNIEFREMNNFNVEAGEAVNIVTDASGDAHSWQFGDNGNLTFPDSTVQTTAWDPDNIDWAGIVGPTIQTNGLPVGTRFTQPAPASSVGQAGDTAGTVAFDDGYIYYCIENFGGTTYEVVHAIADGTSTNGVDQGYLVANTYQLPQVGWKVYYDGETRTIDQVNSSGIPNFYVIFVDSALVIPGQATFAWGPTPATNIWKRVAWSGDTW